MAALLPFYSFRLLPYISEGRCIAIMTNKTLVERIWGGLNNYPEHNFTSIVEHLAEKRIEIEDRYQRHLAEIEEMHNKHIAKYRAI